MRITINIVCGYSLEENSIRKRLSSIVSSLPCTVEKINIFCPFFKVQTKISNAKRVGHSYTRSFVKTSNFFLRFFQELLVTKKLFTNSNLFPCEIILVSIPSMFCLFYLEKTQKTIILDIRDLTWEYFSGGIIKQVFRHLFTNIAKKSFSLCDYIICTNDIEKQLLLQKYNVAAKKIYILPNGISFDDFNKIKKIKACKRSEKPILSYIGNIGLAQNLGTLIEAARYLSQLKIYIVGSGLEFDHLVKKCKDQSLGHVKFLGELKTESLLKVYEKTNILYGQIQQEYFSAIPSKVYEYLASGRYVIFGAEGATKNMLKKFNHNQVISPNNSDILVKKIFELIRMQDHLAISLKNRETIQSKFIRENNSRKVLFKILKNYQNSSPLFRCQAKASDVSNRET